MQRLTTPLGRRLGCPHAWQSQRRLHVLRGRNGSAGQPLGPPSGPIWPGRGNSIRVMASSQPASSPNVVASRVRQIRWGSWLSTAESLEAAIPECVARILAGIGRDAEPELAIVFVSSAHGGQYDKVIPLLRQQLPSLKFVFGCSVSALLDPPPSMPSGSQRLSTPRSALVCAPYPAPPALEARDRSPLGFPAAGFRGGGRQRGGSGGGG